MGDGETAWIVVNRAICVHGVTREKGKFAFGTHVRRAPPPPEGTTNESRAGRGATRDLVRPLAVKPKRIFVAYFGGAFDRVNQGRAPEGSYEVGEGT